MSVVEILGLLSKVKMQMKPNDPLLHPSMEIQPDKMARLTSGTKIFSQLDNMISKKQAISSVLLGPETTTDLFSTVFPDIVESNSVGKITSDTWSHWKPGNNEVTLEEDARDLNNILDSHKGKDLYIGGPAALCSAALQSR